jgi:hypothetical protein
MKDTQLMLGVRPDGREYIRVQAGAIGHDDARLEAMAGEVLQEAAHVLLVVVGHQGEGHGKIAQRVGRQQEREPAQTVSGRWRRGSVALPALVSAVA